MIETERLILREYTLDDFDALYEIYKCWLLSNSDSQWNEKGERVCRP